MVEKEGEGGTGAEAEVEREEDLAERKALIGHWTAHPDMGMFGFAAVTPHRYVVIWEEEAERAVRSFALPIHRVAEGRIYVSENDVGVQYGLFRDETGRETLHFEVRSDDPEMGRFELILIRDRDEEPEEEEEVAS